MDWAEQQGIAICAEPILEDDPNRGGVLIGAQTPFPALEPTLYRTGVARRVVIIEARRTPATQ
ncbi:MAG: hypothetical protein HY332_05725 [Chloroflexi bacterium]|nr:hypothetical protein [Chloroflexota bacterium]